MSHPLHLQLLIPECSLESVAADACTFTCGKDIARACTTGLRRMNQHSTTRHRRVPRSAAADHPTWPYISSHHFSHIFSRQIERPREWGVGGGARARVAGAAGDRRRDLAALRLRLCHGNDAHPNFVCEGIKLTLSGNEVYYTNSSILLVKNVLCGKLHRQKV